MSNSGKLSNKIALVTGGSKGIGASIAKHLGAAGATVVVNYSSSKSAADRTVAEIQAEGGTAWAVQGDFSKPEEITRVFSEIKQKHEKLDILVNNAGVFGYASLEDTTPEEFYRQVNLNVLGLLLATKEAAAMIGPEGGSVINIGSLSGQMPAAGLSIYSATKGALNSITVSLSKELGPRKIRVNAINPGMVATPGLQSDAMGDNFEEKVLKSTPIGRIGQPEDIAKSAVFLASDDASWITGQLLNVSGGTTF
ncbi:short-chain dehydrogenase/reductase SDR [Clostridium sp. DL-VIII]|uniref:SDR family NAD(P)-dependent oxidoreductase n=1 Tax=Clostridium sp. DL-VIII TaxID=641107 RepID=UPI00023AFBB7|nr:glucose 1-dehydrogenase [Clostridium sp. DL-VIII]EHI99481.1 short-chain dehydrogenase/reductase SDR [Clostridium sp. DL-VIII]